MEALVTGGRRHNLVSLLKFPPSSFLTECGELESGDLGHKGNTTGEKLCD